jgi:hypothetical protein
MLYFLEKFFSLFLPQLSYFHSTSIPDICMISLTHIKIRSTFKLTPVVCSSCSSADGHHFNVHSSPPLVAIRSHITPYEAWGSSGLDHRHYLFWELASRKTGVNLMDILRSFIVFLSSSKVHSDSTSITRRQLPYKSLKIRQLYQSAAGSLNKPKIQNYPCAACSLTLREVCLRTGCWECLDPRVRGGGMTEETA